LSCEPWRLPPANCSRTSLPSPTPLLATPPPTSDLPFLRTIARHRLSLIIMLARRAIARAAKPSSHSALFPASRGRPFSHAPALLTRIPALGDIVPGTAAAFDAKQTEFREGLRRAQEEREQKEGMCSLNSSISPPFSSFQLAASPLNYPSFSSPCFLEPFWVSALANIISPFQLRPAKRNARLRTSSPER